MTTQVNLHSSLDSNVAQSKGVEPEVLQFSIINLLPAVGDNKESSPTLDEFAKQEEVFQEFPEERKELTASEFLQYWELPPPPNLEFSIETVTNETITNETATNAPSTSTGLEELTLPKADNPISIHSLPENISNKLTSNLDTIIDDKLSKPIAEEVVPVSNNLKPEMQATIAPVVIQQTTLSNDIDNSEEQLNAVAREMKQIPPTESSPKQTMPTEFMTPTESIMNTLEPETHQVIAVLIKDKEQGDIYSYQNVGKIANQEEKNPDAFADRIDVLPTHLIEQGQSLPVSDFLLQPKVDNTPSFKQEELVTQTNSAPSLENQTMVNNDARVQQLTNHLNDFLNHSMANNVKHSGSETNSIQSQFRMELLSLKPEILADHPNYKTENYTAQLNLHPAELGQITAKIEVIQGAATITFITEHAHAQQLMEHHLPELRNVFQNSDLNLTSVNIHNGGAQDKNEPGAYKRPEKEDDLKRTDNHNKNLGINNVQRKNSIIDTYA